MLAGQILGWFLLSALYVMVFTFILMVANSNGPDDFIDPYETLLRVIKALTSDDPKDFKDGVCGVATATFWPIVLIVGIPLFVILAPLAAIVYMWFLIAKRLISKLERPKVRLDAN